MAKFWELLQESVLVQAALTLIVTGGVMTMSFLGRPVDEQWWTLLGLAWGFYFGTKIQRYATVRRQKEVE